MTLPQEFEALARVFGSAVENADALITITDRDGRIEYVNPSFCEQMGYGPHEAKDRNIKNIYAESGVSGNLEEINSALKSSERWRGELAFSNKDKQTIWCRTTISPVKDDNGVITHFVWVQLDITEQKEYERKHLLIEKRLQSILDHIPAYVFSKSRDGQYTYVNKMLSMLHMMDADDILGKTDHDLFPKEAAERFSKNDEMVFERKKTIHALEDGGTDEYGIERSYLSVKCPLENEDGDVEEILGMSIDISEQKRLEKALRESEEKLSSILDNMKARVYIKDKEFKYTYANQELCRILNTDRINMLGKDDFEMFELETAVGFRKTDEEVFKTGQKVESMEMSIEPDTKEKRYYWSVKVPLMDSTSDPYALLGISTDVTAQKRLEKELRQNEERLTTILENIKAHVYIKDVNFTYTYVNADMCRYLGKSKEEVVGFTDAEAFGEQTSIPFHESDQQVFDYMETSSSIEKSTHYDTGEEHYFWSTKVPLVNDLGNPYALLGISTDVSEQVRLEKELRAMASTDVLTGVNNRRHFLELCEKEVKRAKRYNNDLALIMLDIDHFKQINDTYGHAVGDDAIKAMTVLCQDNLRSTDILGRIGGEEFAMLLPETDITGAWQIAQRIRTSAESLTFNTGTDVIGKFTASFGITSFHNGDATPDDLLKRADIALYDAKTQGRNRVCEK